ncbi:MAG: type II toxin-antitoxin system PemK/MazF family toxin [Candidatus Limnocylindrales bacterium]
MSAPARWGIVLIDLDPTVGHEQVGTRRALVVSREPFHRSGMATICPISARPPRYPAEVAIPSGEAGQTLDAAILCHQVRTIDLRRVTALRIGGRERVVTDPAIRATVRQTLARHLGLDLPAELDGAA